MQYFESSVTRVWYFQIDSHQICRNWLKARVVPLSNEDIQQYQRIIMLLNEINKLMEEIKTVIQCERLKKLVIFENVRAIIVGKLGIESEKITLEASFANDLGTDSLDTVELVIAIEEVFKIDIPNRTAATLLTVQNVIDYICQKVEVVV